MEIRCPKCLSVYQIVPSRIPRAGAKLRCPECLARLVVTRVVSKNRKTKEKKSSPPLCPRCKNEIDPDDSIYKSEGENVCRSCFEKTNEKSKDTRDLHFPKNINYSAQPKNRSFVENDLFTPKKGIIRSFFKGFENLFSHILSNDLAIDLGTANTLIYIRKKGIVLNEPSVTSLQEDHYAGERVLAVGLEAKKMEGKAPDNIRVIRPLQSGVISDFEIAGVMLKYFIKKVTRRFKPIGSRAVITVPLDITEVEKRAVSASAKRAGCRKVFLIEEPIAAAIGANMPVMSPVCNMVLDIGGGTTDVAAISLSGVVCGMSLRVAGDKMDRSIQQYIKKKYNFNISERTAESIKIEIGNAIPDGKNRAQKEVMGWEVASGRPKVFTISDVEIRESLETELKAIIESAKVIMEQIPQDFIEDIFNSGILLTGGVALLKNLDQYLSQQLGIPVIKARDPLKTVVIGSGKTLADINNYMHLLRQ